MDGSNSLLMKEAENAERLGAVHTRLGLFRERLMGKITLADTPAPPKPDDNFNNRLYHGQLAVANLIDALSDELSNLELFLPPAPPTSAPAFTGKIMQPRIEGDA